MIKNIKKWLLLGSIITVGIIVLMLMASILFNWITSDSENEIHLMKNSYFVSALLSFCILCVDCFFNHSALSVIYKTKKLAFISIILLNLASICGLIILWGFVGFKNIPDWFGKPSLILAITAAFFTMIISSNAKLNGHVKPLRIIYFSLIVFVDIVLILSIINEKLSLFQFDGFIIIFILICLAIFALMCVCSIIGKKIKDDVDESYVKIKKTEYDELLNKIKLLEEENYNLKQQSNIIE